MFLGTIADLDAGTNFDLARICDFHAEDKPQQYRFSGPVRSDQPDPFPMPDQKTYTAQYRAGIRLLYIRQFQYLVGTAPTGQLQSHFAVLEHRTVQVFNLFQPCLHRADAAGEFVADLHPQMVAFECHFHPGDRTLLDLVEFLGACQAFLLVDDELGIVAREAGQVAVFDLDDIGDNSIQ